MNQPTNEQRKQMAEAGFRLEAGWRETHETWVWSCERCSIYLDWLTTEHRRGPNRLRLDIHTALGGDEAGPSIQVETFEELWAQVVAYRLERGI